MTMLDSVGYIHLFLLWLVSVVLVRLLSAKLTKPKSRLPPSPPSLPLIGHLHLVGQNPHEAFQKLSSRYGPLLYLKLGSVSCVVTSSPDMARDLIKTHDIAFSNRPKIGAVDYLTYGTADFAFSPYGAYWKFMKKMCVSELLGGRSLEQLRHVRQEEIGVHFLNRLLRSAEKGMEVDVGGELIMLTNNIISKMVMSKRCSEKEDEAYDVRKLVKEGSEICGKFNLADYFLFCKRLDLQGIGKKLEEIHGRFDRMLEGIINEHKEARKEKETGGKGGTEAKDLLDILLDISEDERAEMRLTKENIKAFIKDIFSGGTDTSAATMEWAFSELLNHPTIMAKARQEIDTTVGKARTVQESDIPNLPYLQAIVKETLRLHPASPLIMRESSETCNLACGFEIPAKTRLLVNLWAMGRDPKYWEEPTEFRPERFVGGEIDVKGQHFQLLPFGSGRRGCPGMSLALHVVHTTLAVMIQCFEWKVAKDDDENCGGVDMEAASAIVLSRVRQLRCVPVTRLRPFPSGVN